MSLKDFIPPVFFSLLRKPKKQNNIQETWSGDFASWKEASMYYTGYDSELILEKCKNALMKVKNGEAVYERDTILYDKIQYSWGLLAILQKAALENGGKLCVLDFGGSLGSSYYQNKDFLSQLQELKWCIVEQPNFVNCGKKYFENEQLKFYYTMKDCISGQKPDVLLLSGVLQYLEKPYEIVNEIIRSGIKYIVIDRLALSNEEKDILTIQHVPAKFYKSDLGHWFFSYKNFLSKMTIDYNLLGTAISFAEDTYLLNGKINCFFKLLIFKRK